MDKKTSFIIYPERFISNIYHFKKNEIADLIIALCEYNINKKLEIKLSPIVQEKFDLIQDGINENNTKYEEICEKRKASGSKGGSKSKAKGKQTKKQNQTSPCTEQEKEEDKDNVFIKNKNKERDNVDKLEIGCVPSVEDVAAYAKESGYTIDPVAFVKWNSERGWMNGKKFIGVDWRKAVRKWYCKENGLSVSEMETMADIAGGILSKIKVVQDENNNH